jgi:hypothetical protein
MKRLVPGVVALVIVGCGNDDTATSSTTTASARQAASIVAPHLGAITAAIDADEQCQSGIDCLAAVARINRFEKIALAIDGLRAALRASGPVEREVTALRSATLTMTDEVFEVARRAADCINANRGKAIDPCEPALSEFQGHYPRIRAQLGAWDPYI